MHRALYRLTTIEAGGTAAEYALLAALIAIAIVGAVHALGINLEALFSDDELVNALNS